jgi:hypothetical protein
MRARAGVVGAAVREWAMGQLRAGDQLHERAGSTYPAPGDSLQSNWFFGTGEWRMVLGVASQASMSDQALDASASITIK